MPYLGNTPTTQSFISGTDYFNGTGAQTAFTLSRTVASVNDIQAVVNNVVQVPNDAYTISGTTITFTSAPSSGTQNVYVRYLSTTTQAITPSQNTVSWSTLDSNVQGDLGISFKNRIINGNMAIDQRNAGAVQTSPASNTYNLDRWLINVGGGGFNVQQTPSATETGFATRVAAGFTNYLAITSTAVTSASNYNLRQFIEGFNSADLAFGTASAKTITLSFWVYSSLTGTFGGSIQNAAGNRSYVFSYTIATANTWQQVTATIPGDTSGTWIGATNGIGLILYIAYSTAAGNAGAAGSWTANDYRAPTGQVNVVGTNGATWYITGVQLEVGTQATTFTTAGGSYGAELQLCQRYFYKSYDQGIAVGSDSGLGQIIWTACATSMWITHRYKQTMRTAPTVTFYSNATAGANYWNNFNDNSVLTTTAQNIGDDGVRISTTSNQDGQRFGGQLTASAEL